MSFGRLMSDIVIDVRTDCEYILCSFFSQYLTPNAPRTVDSYMLGGRGGYAAGLTADMFCSAPGGKRIQPPLRRHVYTDLSDTGRT